ncbi:DUF688 domain-containing protein [Melia azedarach]|uniref:DUF688 domain-containing protein n=1 Tax=Melia azedarach TaxID=155640 RepID=A0ACC1YTW8_MELAZ|nr:DUF688 domain-containing protein [Melia azedarach]
MEKARKMDSESEQDHGPSLPPKLSLFSFPSKAHEPPGMLTPPIHPQAAVPFQWEEAPGKPRPCSADAGDSKPKVARCLELPPRLLTETKVSGSTDSPTTVLDGPYVGDRSLLNTLSFRSPATEKIYFGSSRWGSVKKNNKEVIVGGGFDFLFPDGHDGSRNSGSGGDGTKVKITRITKRSGSFLSLSQAKSQNLLTSIYESFKQVVPWTSRRRRQDKLTKTSSH